MILLQKKSKIGKKRREKGLDGEITKNWECEGVLKKKLFSVKNLSFIYKTL